MSTRFDSRKNNPNSQTLTSKRKVLREFQKMQEQLQNINQETIFPEGEEFFEDDHERAETEEKEVVPERQSQLLNKVWENEEYFSLREQENIDGVKKRFNSLNSMSHTKRTRKSPLHNHKMDFGQLNSMNTFHQTILQPRSTGFIDFDLQTKRPAFPVAKAHEHRFQYLNHFPTPISTAKHVPKVDFKKQIDRRDENAVSMSESCFSHDKVDLVKTKARGTLQFGRSTMLKLSAQPAKPKVYASTNYSRSKYNSLPATNVASPVLKFERQMSRVPNFGLLSAKVTKEDRRAMNKLPSHMHNVNNRMACTNTLERTLRESKYQQADFLNPKSTVEIKSFRHDPDNSITNEGDLQVPKKKKMTFSQLLVKFGYITQDKSKENRKRPWHITPINPDGYSSSEDDENVGI